ncbi:MAG: transposase [Ignavibacteria bacterium]
MSKFQDKYRIESNRLAGFDYSQSFWYYVTVCTNNKICYFGKINNSKCILNLYGKILEEEILYTQKLKKAEVDSFVIMPNHFHAIIIPESKIFLGTIMGQIKSITTKRIVKEGLKEFKWQSNYYEHIIRNEIDLYRIQKYIELNPLQWELDEYFNL